jgi:transcriptional regulator with XRE-family HTH domain
MRRTLIAEQLKAWREVRGLSQRALAERAGMVYVMVARLELGRTDPRLSTLERLAAALRIEVVDLLTGPPQAKRPARKRARGK